MKNLTIISTSSIEWTFENHGFGAVALASKLIADGETVYFDCYNRNPLNSTEMIFQARHYFGLMDIDKYPALRTSSTSYLDAVGSHSIISSRKEKHITTDPVFIASALMQFLRAQYIDFFIK